MKKRTLAALLAVILAFALVLSACGKTDDDDEDEDESRPAKTEERADKEGQKAKPRHYREQRWYDADGALLEVDSFDVDGHLIRYDVYTEDGDLDYIIEMRSTDDCEVDDVANQADGGSDEDQGLGCGRRFTGPLVVACVVEAAHFGRIDDSCNADGQTAEEGG